LRSLGRSIVEQGRTEAVLRTAIGRAYYTAFLLARDRTGVTTTHGAHLAVITQLRMRDRTAGHQLDVLRHLRTVADYELRPRRTADQDWVRNWAVAETIVSNLLRKLSMI
jgi:hypothetical protein